MQEIDITQTPSQISIKPGYRPQSEDKTPLADAVDFYRLRQLTNSQRWQISASLTRWTKAVSLRGMRNACPETYKISQFVKALETAGFYCPLGAIPDIRDGRGRVLSVTHYHKSA